MSVPREFAEQLVRLPCVASHYPTIHLALELGSLAGGHRPTLGLHAEMCGLHARCLRLGLNVGVRLDLVMLGKQGDQVPLAVGAAIDESLPVIHLPWLAGDRRRAAALADACVTLENAHAYARGHRLVALADPFGDGPGLGHGWPSFL